MTKYKSNNECSQAVLKAIQFNSLVEFGIKDSTVYNVIDLEEFYNMDSINAKKEWDNFIDGSRFLEGQKTTLRTNYVDYTCNCITSKRGYEVTLIYRQKSDMKFEIIKEDSLLRITHIKTVKR